MVLVTPEGRVELWNDRFLDLMGVEAEQVECYPPFAALMLDNHAYNLMMQLIEEHKSLWRIKNDYKNDSSGCEECQEVWDKLQSSKEGYIKELEDLVKKHLG